jgi:Flp pilus assembly protein TadG
MTTSRSTTKGANTRPRRHGQAAVEMALTMTIFLVIIYGIIEVSRVVFISAEMGNAAREGSQYIALNAPSGGNLSATATAVIATAQVRAKEKLVMADRALTQVIVPSFTPCTFCVVTVTVTYPWTPILRFPGLPNITLDSTATKLIENGTP